MRHEFDTKSRVNNTVARSLLDLSAWRNVLMFCNVCMLFLDWKALQRVCLLLLPLNMLHRCCLLIRVTHAVDKLQRTASRLFLLSYAVVVGANSECFR